MSLIDALAIVSCAVAAAIGFVAFMAAVLGAVSLPILAVAAVFDDGWDWFVARCLVGWIGCLAALVLLIWIDGNVEPWWPR